MTPYLEFYGLPQEILMEAVSLERSVNAWNDALVYASHGLASSIELDKDSRCASVVRATNATSLYDLFERYVSQAVLPAAYQRWGLSSLMLEGTQLIRYSSGGFFVPHRDSTAIFSSRCLTILSYLSNNFDDGHTYFPDFDMFVEPRIGKTIVFLSEHLHASQPLRQGEKYVLATWARCAEMPVWI
jgi:predicted 2-oxoglutarate/Fe(II)-dependent dioxygenase YbiX